MERLVIIDHTEHSVFIEDVTDEDLAAYGGEEEAYIRDNYDVEGNMYSWEYLSPTNGIFYVQGGNVVELEIPTEDEFGLYVNEAEGKAS